MFIKYRIENGDLSLKFIPIGELYADIFTKPLQGETFWKFWDMIQGIPDSTTDADMSCPRATSKVTSQECVGKNYRQTYRTATTSTDDHVSTCTYKRHMEVQARMTTEARAQMIVEARARKFLMRVQAYT